MLIFAGNFNIQTMDITLVVNEGQIKFHEVHFGVLSSISMALKVALHTKSVHEN